MDVIEEHCTLYKTAGSGFYLHGEKKMQQGKQRSSKRGGRVDGKGENRHTNMFETRIFKLKDLVSVHFSY